MAISSPSLTVVVVLSPLLERSRHLHGTATSAPRPNPGSRAFRVFSIACLAASAAFSLLPNSASAAGGDLVPRFGDGGKVTTEVTYEFPRLDTVREVALQSDGKIVAAGTSEGDFAIARYLADGSLDPSFGHGGRVTTSFFAPFRNSAGAMAIQPNGKIVVAGTTGPRWSKDFALARFMADGSLDSSFSGDGKRTTDFGGDDGITSIILESDRRLLAIGFGMLDDSDYTGLAVARYKPDGSADRSFADDGKQYVGRSFTPNDAALQEDGKIVIAGCIACATPASHTEFGLARLHRNGSLDTGFAGDGVIAAFFADDLWSFVEGSSVAVQGDGKIVAAVSGGNVKLSRWNPDGTIDSTFADDGVVPDAPLAISEVAVDAHGRIVAAGRAGHHLAVARFNGAGELDAGFSDEGVATADFGADGRASALALQRDGRIVAAGRSTRAEYVDEADADADFALARFEPEGSPDESFSGDGQLTTSFGTADIPSDAQTLAGAISPDRKILVLASADPRRGPDGFAVLRYNRDGSLDPSFAGDGIMIETVGYSAQADALAVQRDGKVLVGGEVDGPTLEEWGLWRYNPDGSVDTTFGNSGRVRTDFGGRRAFLADLALADDGSIVGAGYAFSGDRDYALARYLPDGTLDSTFGNSGTVIVESDGPEWSWLTGLVLTDQRIVAAGETRDSWSARGDFGLVGVTLEGALDGDFGTDGLIETDFLRAETAGDLAVAPGGGIVAAGSSFDQVHGSRFALARYTPLGALDPTFSRNGLVQTGFSGGSAARAVTVQDDKRILAGGGASGNFALVRYGSDGTLDETFSRNGRSRLDFGGSDSVVALGVDGRTIIAVGTTGDEEVGAVALAKLKRGRLASAQRIVARGFRP